MLFNSYAFIFFFLPAVFLGFFLIARRSHFAAASWLTFASLFFYGWWNPAYVGLLLVSIAFNFAVGQAVGRAVTRGAAGRAKATVAFGIAADLALLGYYKYTDFFVANLNQFAGTQLPLPHIVLPLGISFFTFTQIAFLVDTYQGYVKEYRFVHYALFVTYFPHLIAGPILHHKEMMPQFGAAQTYRPDWENVAVGLTIFAIGLFKKTVLADGFAEYVGPVFRAAEAGARLPLFDAWGGILAYSFQLYFDFSGYSDMAIGLSRLFGVDLPLNFHSPYKAASMSELWQRWHMTLSRFLRDYLFFPLGGRRRSALRRYYAVLVTMLLGGLWHGAGWTYIVWGALQGVFIAVHRTWEALTGGRRRARAAPGMSRHAFAVLVTFVAWLIGLAFFRSESLGGAVRLLRGMAGFDGLVLPYRWLDKWGAAGHWLAAHGAEFQNLPTFAGGGQLNLILVGFIIVWGMPNTQQIMAAYRPALNLPADTFAGVGRWWAWKPTPAWLAAGIIVLVTAMLNISGLSEFIYFQF